MGRFVVCKVSELPPSGRRIVRVNGREIGVFNVKGRYYALRNLCPHQSAPLCLGQLTGLAVSDEPGEIEWTREGEILRCPGTAGNLIYSAAAPYSSPGTG